MRIPAVLMGQAIGDALGMPFEALKGKHKDLDKWDGKSFLPGTWHKLPAGHFTDDTEMAVELAESLILRDGFEPADVATRYVRWFKDTPHGMGGTVRKACEALSKGSPWNESGVQFADDQWPVVGNGTAMRVAPLGVAYPWQANTKLVDAAHRDAIITHNNTEAIGASIAVARAVSFLIQFPEASPEAFLGSILPVGIVPGPYIQNAAFSPQDLLNVPGVERGNAVFTVSTALYSVFQNFDSFPKAIEHAIRQGGDTDTRAAIVGAIMGAKVGYVGIPDEWTEHILQADRLYKLDEKLMKLRTGRI